MINPKKKKKVKMKSIDYILFYTILVLLAIGIIMVYSASSYYSMNETGSSTSYLKKQLLATVLELIAMAVTMSIDYHKLKKIVWIAYIVTAPLLLLVKAFPAVKGAQRWIMLGPLSFQPSELAKYVLVILLAVILAGKGEQIKEFKKGVLVPLGFAFFYALLVIIQKNLSITVVIVAVAFVMLFCAGAKIKHLFGYVFPVLLAGVAALAVLEPYRMKRLMNFTDPFQSAADEGYQLVQSFYALGAGGFSGLGLGQSRQKTMYMPEPHNDFIFSIIGEELGFIGCFVIILLFLLLIWRGIKTAFDAKDMLGKLMATGITSVIAFQAIINIAVVTGSMPVTGVPLPFISYGGTSLLITLSAMGILLNISRQKNVEEQTII